MFITIEPDQRDDYRDLLEGMFRNRHDVVVDQWGWDVPGAGTGRDADQFDTDDTVYIIVTKDGGDDVVASSRLNPTTKPHMLSELFAEYCNLQPFPQSPSVLECSRYVIDKTKFSDPAEEFRHRAAVGIGVTRYCLANGISKLSWLTHQKFYNIAQIVWKTEPLGLPHRDQADGWSWIAAVSDIDEVALKRQQDRYDNAEEVVAAFLSKSKSKRSGKAA